MKVLLSKLGADRLGTFISNDAPACTMCDDAGLSCNFAGTHDNKFLGRDFQIDIGVSLQQMQNFESQVKKISDRITTSEDFQRK